MKNSTFALLATAFILLAGCAPYTATVKYGATQEQLATMKMDRSITVGSFTDNRGLNEKTDANWLGVIRNGFGMPVQTLITDIPVRDAIKIAFSDALETRKVNLTQSNAPIEIEGSIIQFECDAIFDYGATAHLQINVLSLPSRNILYSKMFKTYNTQVGHGKAVYGGYVDMAKLAERTLNETIDKFFADPLFIAAVTKPQTSTIPNSNPSTSERLRELERLKNENLISDVEYKAKRSEIIGKL